MKLKNPDQLTGVFFFFQTIRRLGFFHPRSYCPPHRFHFLHAFLDGRFGKVGTFLELLQNARALVLLLEAAQRAVDGFMILYNYADHINSPPSIMITVLWFILLAAESLRLDVRLSSSR